MEIEPQLTYPFRADGNDESTRESGVIMAKKRSSKLHWVAMLALLLIGCGSDQEAIELNDGSGGSAFNDGGELSQEELCDQMCHKVYEECGMAFIGSGGTPASQEDCYQACLEDAFDGSEQCILDAPCTEEGLMACLQGSSSDNDGGGSNDGNDGDDRPYDDSDGLADPCDEPGGWPDQWANLEAEVVELVNQIRSEGATCGTEEFGAAPPLVMDDLLQCAARRHSLDMARYDYFSHTSLDGQGPGERMSAVGYSYTGWGENIAGGRATAEAAVAGWMDSPQHCSNIMNSGFQEIGVGHVEHPNFEYGIVWTQKFGRK